MAEQFSIERVHKSGAKFDYEKAKWFNHEWIKNTDAAHLFSEVKKVLTSKLIDTNDDVYLKKIITLVKERCALITDFIEQSSYFFEAPELLDTDAVKPKWNQQKKDFFEQFCVKLNQLEEWKVEVIEQTFKDLSASMSIKPGELQLPMRIMLVGGKFGPAVFEIAHLIGNENTINRIQSAIPKIEKP